MHRRIPDFHPHDSTVCNTLTYMDVSENSGTPKSSILIGYSIINHPFWGETPYFWISTHITSKRHGLETVPETEIFGAELITHLHIKPGQQILEGHYGVS